MNQSLTRHSADELYRSRLDTLASVAHALTPEFRTVLEAKLRYEHTVLSDISERQEKEASTHEEEQKKLNAHYFVQKKLSPNIF